MIVFAITLAIASGLNFAMIKFTPNIFHLVSGTHDSSIAQAADSTSVPFVGPVLNAVETPKDSLLEEDLVDPNNKITEKNAENPNQDNIAVADSMNKNKLQSKKSDEPVEKENNIKSTAKFFENMNAESAVKILNGMSDNEAKNILNNIKKRQAGKILSLLEPSRAARILR